MAQNEVPLYFHDRLMRPLLFLIPVWVTPNAITVLRLFLIPFVLWQLWNESYVWGTILFFFAAFTDALDGTLARVRKKITQWGILFDPIADKLLIGSVLLLIALRYIAWWLVACVLCMELVIIVAALLRRQRGNYTQANMWGKLKMFCEFVALMCLLLGIQGWFAGILFAEYALFVALIFGGISYVTYSP